MSEYSHADVERLIHENSKLKGREAREKSQAVEYTEKAVVALTAGAVGFGIGVVNAQNGATAETPYSLGGSIPIDAVAAGVGLVAILATPAQGKNASLMPVSLGLGGAGIGIWAQRAGYQWQQARAGTTTAPATTTSGYVGWGGRMAPRMAQPGIYGGVPNPYVQQYA
jgi:hypothetical protein